MYMDWKKKPDLRAGKCHQTLTFSLISLSEIFNLYKKTKNLLTD